MLGSLPTSRSAVKQIFGGPIGTAGNIGSGPAVRTHIVRTFSTDSRRAFGPHSAGRLRPLRWGPPRSGLVPRPTRTPTCAPFAAGRTRARTPGTPHAECPHLVNRRPAATPSDLHGHGSSGPPSPQQGRAPRLRTTPDQASWPLAPHPLRPALLRYRDGGSSCPPGAPRRCESRRRWHVCTSASGGFPGGRHRSAPSQ